MLPFLQDQTRAPELRQMEGKRAVRHAESICDRTRRHAFVAGLYKQPKEGEPMLLRERSERFDGGVAFHHRKDAQWMAAVQHGALGGAVTAAMSLCRNEADECIVASFRQTSK